MNFNTSNRYHWKGRHENLQMAPRWTVLYIMCDSASFHKPRIINAFLGELEIEYFYFGNSVARCPNLRGMSRFLSLQDNFCVCMCDNEPGNATWELHYPDRNPAENIWVLTQERRSGKAGWDNPPPPHPYEFLF